MSQIPDNAAMVARTSAARLTEYGPDLPHHVEAALHADGPPAQFGADPVAIASLIVSIAALAWTVIVDLRKNSIAPASDVVGRRVRVQIPAGPAARDRIIEIVVEESLRLAERQE